jgi:predicted MPP superfamily phosphohydrolase
MNYRILSKYRSELMGIAMLWVMFFHASDLKQKDYDITIPGAEEMTVVLISDVHLGAVGSEKRLPEIVEKINALEPDLVCIAGDFFDSDFSAIRNPDAAAATLKTLSAPYGVWAVLGNHDAGSTAAQMQEYLTRCGIHLLNDEYAVVGEKLVLGGKMDRSPIGGFGNLTGSDLILTDISDLPVIVMDHNPAHIHQYGAEVDLILSGHTHKGQIFPGSLITNGMYTVDYGYYRADEASPQVIVSSGVGTWGMPMRVGSDCEIVMIKIHS